MSARVQAFVDRHWQPLLTHMRAWCDHEGDRRATLNFVRGVREEWAGISLQHKETRDVAWERNFWAGLNGLELCALGREGIQSSDGRFPDNFESMLVESLEKTYDCMYHRKPLVEGCFIGQRPIP